MTTSGTSGSSNPRDGSGGPTDESLAAALQRGDRSAMDAIVERFHRPLYRLVFGYVKDDEDAREVLQEVFFRMYRHITRYETDRKFSPWLFKIAVNECLHHLRRRKRAKTSDVSEIAVAATSPGPSAAVIDGEEARILWGALDKIPPEYQQVILLKYQQQMSNDEIAEVCGISDTNLRVRLFRAKALLRKHLGSAVDDRSEVRG
jgi:RNA polymerase sigma-70 factor (ECF subfamily)